MAREQQLDKAISIIGLGPMGQAMTQSFLAKGYTVTVWNRTTSKADAMVEAGAQKAATVADALAASQLVILSLTDYDVFYQVMEPAVHALKDRVLINLSSDTPAKVRKAAAWAARHGAEYLAGGVMVPPPMVGKPEAYVFYSGNQLLFEAHQQTLQVIGRPDYLGNDPGLALLYYQALLDIMFFSLTGIVHAMALVRSADVKATTFGPIVQQFLPLIPLLVQQAGKEIETRKYFGEENNMHMLTASISHVVQASNDAGIDTTMPSAIYNVFKKAIDKGFGKDGYTSIIEVIEQS